MDNTHEKEDDARVRFTFSANPIPWSWRVGRRLTCSDLHWKHRSVCDYFFVLASVIFFFLWFNRRFVSTEFFSYVLCAKYWLRGKEREMLENEQRKMFRDQIEDFNSKQEIRTRIYVLRIWQQGEGGSDSLAVHSSQFSSSRKKQWWITDIAWIVHYCGVVLNKSWYTKVLKLTSCAFVVAGQFYRTITWLEEITEGRYRRPTTQPGDTTHNSKQKKKHKQTTMR